MSKLYDAVRKALPKVSDTPKKGKVPTGRRLSPAAAGRIRAKAEDILGD